MILYTILLGGITLNKKFSKNKLLKIANSGLADLSCEQIKNLIQKESQKNYEDINTDFIDLCFDLLEMKQNDKSSKISNIKIGSKKNSIKRALIVAAVFVIFIATTLTALAQFNLNIPQKIAKLINGNAEIQNNLKFADTTPEGYALSDTDLSKQVAEYGISPVTFPEEMIKEHCNINKVENITSDKNISTDVIIDFKYYGDYGNVNISKFSEDFNWIGYNDSTDVVSGQVIKVNGLDVLIFEREGSCTIIYKDNLTEYNIYLESDIDMAIQFAESIK